MECCICLEPVVFRRGQCVNCKGIMHYYCATRCVTCPLCRFNSREYGAIVTLQAVFRGVLSRSFFTSDSNLASMQVHRNVPLRNTPKTVTWSHTVYLLLVLIMLLFRGYLKISYRCLKVSQAPHLFARKRFRKSVFVLQMRLYNTVVGRKWLYVCTSLLLLFFTE